MPASQVVLWMMLLLGTVGLDGPSRGWSHSRHIWKYIPRASSPVHPTGTHAHRKTWPRLPSRPTMLPRNPRAADQTRGYPAETLLRTGSTLKPDTFSQDPQGGVPRPELSWCPLYAWGGRDQAGQEGISLEREAALSCQQGRVRGVRIGRKRAFHKKSFYKRT